MSEATHDLWPDSVGVDAVVPPLVILREQAALLGERTKGLVRGEVESTERPAEKIDGYLEDLLPPEARVLHSHTLYLVAPALDNYRYMLLNAEHDFQPYPCHVCFHPNPEAFFGKSGVIRVEGRMLIPDEGEFVLWLRYALQRVETIRVVSALVSRVQQLGSSDA